MVWRILIVVKYAYDVIFETWSFHHHRFVDTDVSSTDVSTTDVSSTNVLMTRTSRRPTFRRLHFVDFVSSNPFCRLRFVDSVSSTPFRRLGRFVDRRSVTDVSSTRTFRRLRFKTESTKRRSRNSVCLVIFWKKFLRKNLFRLKRSKVQVLVMFPFVVLTLLSCQSFEIVKS